MKANPKQFWSYVRGKSSVNEKVLKMRKQNEELINNFETSDEMNRAFQRVFTEENEHNTPNFDIRFVGPAKENITGDVNEIKELLRITNGNKSSRPDGIHLKMPSECHNELANSCQLLSGNHLTQRQYQLSGILDLYAQYTGKAIFLIR